MTVAEEIWQGLEETLGSDDPTPTKVNGAEQYGLSAKGGSSGPSPLKPPARLPNADVH